MGFRSDEVEEPAAAVVPCLRGILVPMGRKVIKNDNGSGGDLGDRHFTDVGGGGVTIHRALDDLRRNPRVLRQPCMPQSLFHK